MAKRKKDPYAQFPGPDSIYGKIFDPKTRTANRGGGAKSNDNAIRAALGQSTKQNPYHDQAGIITRNKKLIEKDEERSPNKKNDSTRLSLQQIRNLPPITNPNKAPDVMTPGTGVGNLSRLLRNRGGGKNKGGKGGKNKGGRAPAVDQNLDVNNKGLLKRAKNSAALEYNPQIEAIRNTIQSTQSEGKEAISETGNMYNALAAALGQQVAPINQRFDSSQDKIAGIYGNLSSGIDERYNATTAANQAEFERLGIADVAPRRNAGLVSDRDFLSNIAKLQGQGVNDALEIQQQGAVNLTRNTQNRARMGGINRIDDLRDTLADRLLGLRGEKTGLQGSKSRSVRELQDQYKQEAVAQAERDRAFGLDAAQFQESIKQNRVTNQLNRDQFRWGKQTDKAGMAMDLQQLQTEAAGGGAVDRKSLSPIERAAYDAEQYTPGGGDRAIALIQQLARNKDVRRGFIMKPDRADPTRSNKIPITPEQFGYLVAKNAKRAGLPKGSLQAIATAYWRDSH